MTPSPTPKLHIATWEEWQDAYDTATERHFFLSPLWARAMHAAYPEVQPRALCFTFPTHRVILPCAVTRKLRGCLLGLRSMAHASYGGLLSSGPLDSGITGAIARRLSRYAPLHTLMLSSCPGKEIDGWEELRVHTYTTHVLDLSRGYAAIWEQLFSPKLRQSVNKAVKLGVSVRQDSSREAVDSFYHLYQMQYERLKAHARPKILFETLIRDPSSPARLWLASYENRDIAALLSLDGGRDVVYGYAKPSDSDYWKYCPNDLLEATSLEDSCARGFRWYDMLPSGRAPGVEHSKQKFGAEPATVSEYWLHGLLPSLKRRAIGVGTRVRGWRTEGDAR